MRIRVETPVSVKAALAELHSISEVAMTRAIHAAGRGLQQDLRGQVSAAGLGRGLTNAIRFGGYPKGTVSLNAAAVCWTKAPKIIDAFDRGVVIRATNRRWLAIPTEVAPKRGMGGKRLTPMNFPEHVYGPLRFVYRRPPAPSLLVVDNQRMKQGKRALAARAAGKLRGNVYYASRSKRALTTGWGHVTVPMFLLYAQVKMPKKLDALGAGQRWQAAVPQLYARELSGVQRAVGSSPRAAGTS